jgi:SET domain-containing protein
MKTRRRMSKINSIKNDLVTIKKSKIEGLGVFALDDIPSGTKIADYYGKEMTLKNFKQKYGEYKHNSLNTYRMKRINRIIVAKIEPYKSRNLTNYINESKKPNCLLKKRALYALNNIKKGEELTLLYPENYNRNYTLKNN